LLPDNSFAWRVRSIVFLNLGRAGDAEAAAQRALAIDPESAHGHIVRGQARLLAGRRLEALADFDTALSLDPENAFAHDIRARTLTLAGRNEAAADAAAEALRLAPDSPTAHAARAWQLLHAGDRAGAQDEFRDSLRLDPESNWARLGLVEALKARNPVYRLLLRGLLRMGRVGRRQARAMIALLAAARVAGIATVDHGGAGPYVLTAVALLFLGFVVAATARPLFNAVLRLTPDGRHLLTAAERRESALAATCIFGGVLFAASWGVSGDDAFGLAGASTTLLALLVVVATRMRGRRTRRVAWTVGALSVLTMLLGLGVALAVDGGRLPSPSYVPVAIAAPILATFGVPLLRRPARPAFRLPWCGASAPGGPGGALRPAHLALDHVAADGDRPLRRDGPAGLAAWRRRSRRTRAVCRSVRSGCGASGASPRPPAGMGRIVGGDARPARVARRDHGRRVRGGHRHQARARRGSIRARALPARRIRPRAERRLEGPPAPAGGLGGELCPAGRLLARMHSPRRLLVRT